jgi:AcrR family transcriptional regulator
MTARRQPNPRGQGSRLRGELLDAASSLLEAGGRDAELTLRAVARAAGVAAPSIYQHFADLDELMLALIRAHLADLAGAIELALRPVRDQPAAAQLRVISHAYVRWGLDHPGPYPVVFDGKVLRQLTTDQEAALLAGTDLFSLLISLTAAAIGPGRDPELAATALWTALHGVVALRLAKPAYPWPPLSDHVNAVLDAHWQPR